MQRMEMKWSIGLEPASGLGMLVALVEIMRKATRNSHLALERNAWHTGGTLRARKQQLSTITENKALPGKAGYNCVSALYGIVAS